MKIYIDSGCDIHYSSFYIKGLEQIFGSKNLYFKNKPFSDFKFNNHFFAFIIKDNLINRRIIIDYADSSLIDSKALTWSDFYCKINIDENIQYNTTKLVSIGPSFGIKIYSPSKTLFLAILNFIKSRKRIDNIKRFFSNYKAQLYRPKINDYYPNYEQDNYIFFAGSLWKKEIKTNKYRANFIKACLTKRINFEGGFAPRTKNDIKGFEDLTMKSRETMESFMRKTKKSIIAFNTPAVLDCHGWKLAEFLCFGKAIISTDLSRQLPSELVDKKHIILTNGTQEDIEEKIETLITDKKLRSILKENSRKYFEQELSPDKVIEKIRTLHNNVYKK
ncbi:glycosyltransferase [Lutibacter sp. B1]|uniref:glycosyltransferase n=1 Tax=Lutibacter sp. B1 TaxID=2725996 RepID=UPI001456C6EC|nr:glycosyltransferase family 4 protein [Lutibacter sp. B1]NLP59436.1 glycosyltransferase family 4 protein [Lutibacter sp. B1]